MSVFEDEIPVIYINLDDAVDRRRRLELEFEKYSINAQRLDAIRWSNLDESEQLKYYSSQLNQKQYYAALVNGEKGCYSSHIIAWNLLLSSNSKCMVVLEDDVRLTPDFNLVIQSIAQLDVPWDMIKLIGRKHEKINSKRSLCNGFDLIDYSRVPSYTAGYVISRSGANKILTSRCPFGRPIDVDLRFWWENDLIIYGVWPSVLEFDETSDASTIPGRKVSNSFSVKWRKFQMKMKLTLGNALNRSKRKEFF